MLQDERKFVQLLLRAPKKFRQDDSSYLLQAFLNECEQACRGAHDKEFEPTEASESSRPNVSDGSDDDEMKLRRRNCLCQESSSSNLKLTKTLWLQLSQIGLQTLIYFDLQSLLRTHHLSLAVVPV